MRYGAIQAAGYQVMAAQDALLAAERAKMEAEVQAKAEAEVERSAA